MTVERYETINLQKKCPSLITLCLFSNLGCGGNRMEISSNGKIMKKNEKLPSDKFK